MLHAAAEPRRARRIFAAPDNLFLIAVERAAALGTGRRHLPWLAAGGAIGMRQDRLHDFRDDVAALFNQDAVAGTEIFARHVLGVVERGHRDRRARQLHWLEHGVGRHGAGASDVDLDRLERGCCLLRGELEGGRPPRKLCRGPELLPQREIVHLDDDAVGLEVEALALVAPLGAKGNDLVDVFAAPPVPLDREAPCGERAQRFGMGRDPQGLNGVPRVGHELIDKRAHVALRHQRRIQIPHRAGRGVAGVGEERLARVVELAIDALERRARQVHLAADLDAPRGAAAQRQRNRANRADIGGHVLAARAVAAGGAAAQRSVLVSERDAQAVDLELGHVRDGILATFGALSDALVERAQFLVVVGVVEAEHRHEVLDRVEAFDGTSGNALRRRIDGDEIGVVGLELLELVQQRVELRVGDLGIVVDVIALFMRRSPERLALLEAPEKLARLQRSYDDSAQSSGPSSGAPSTSPATSADRR